MDEEELLLAKHMREALLTDAWGGWRSLDRTFLERMCERMATIVTSFNGMDRHEDCVDAEEYEKLAGELDKASKDLEAVEERERKLLMGRVSALGCVRV